MEACFLTCNSFTKTLDFVPSTLKARVPNFTRFLYKHNGNNSSSLTYARNKIDCQLGPTSSPENDNNPRIDAEWRSFRARLVAGERASRPEEPSTWVNPDIVEDHQPQITIGEKWAHPLHEPEKGCLLIATERLDGVHIFERTVVLILSTGLVGPFGVILNRPSLMSIKEARSTVLDVAGRFSDRPLFFGGPVDEGLFLVSAKEGEVENEVGKSGVFEEVMKGLYFGTNESVGCAAEMVKRNVVGVDDFRFFDGCCGWEKDQLKEEIRAGYWTVAACSPSVIRVANVGSVGLWEEILGLIGERKVW